MGRGNFEGGDGVSHCKEHSVVICAKTAEPIEMPFGLWAWMGSRNRVRWGSRSLVGRGNFLGKGRPFHSMGTFCRELCKTAEPINLPFGLWTRMVPRKHKFNSIRQVAPMCPTLCHELCKNGLTDRFAIWLVDSGLPKEAQVQSYLPGGAG